MLIPIWRYLWPLSTIYFLLWLTGCSSMMAHVAPHEGYYPGTNNDIETLQNPDNGWVVRSLSAVDLPFSAILDTLLLPYDYYRAEHGRQSTRVKIAEADKMK